jgi:hypothetical protein
MCKLVNLRSRTNLLSKVSFVFCCFILFEETEGDRKKVIDETA